MQIPPVLQGLPEVGYVRLAQVLQLVPVSRSTWFNGVATGRFPAPVKITERCSAYRVEDIRALIESLGNAESQA